MLLLFLAEQTLLNPNSLDATRVALGQFFYNRNSKWPPLLLIIDYNFVQK